MGMFDRVINQGQGLLANKQPKRFNFSSNFLGNRDRLTIDEQMMTMFPGEAKAPPGSSYGVYEQVVNEAADRARVQPVNFQDVAWAGAKEIEGKPMIQHVNEAIERTAAVTGKKPKDVVVDSLVTGKSPLYAGGGAAAPTAGLLSTESPQQKASNQDALSVSMDGIDTKSRSLPEFGGQTFETALAMLRGMGVGLLDAIQMIADDMVPESAMLPSGNKRITVPDFQTKYMTKKDKDVAEQIGLFSGPTLF